MKKSNAKEISVVNPFVIYGYEGPDYFCDRDQETRQIVSALANGRNLTLMAPRRIGKTGLIKNVFYHLKRQNVRVACIYVDMFPTRNCQDMVQLLGKAVLTEMQTPVQKITKLLSSCRPVFSFDPLTATPNVTLNVQPEGAEKTIKDLFDYMAASGKECYVALDEFQQIANYPENNVEALLRSHIQFMPNVHFIFAGSSQHMMTEMFLSAKRPFYQSTQLMYLHQINEEAYYRFASSFFLKRGQVFSQKVFRELYNYFNGHTWYVQSVLNRLYERNENVEDIQKVELVINVLLNENSEFYQGLLRLLTDNQRSLLTAVGCEGKVTSPMGSAFIKKYHLGAASSVSSALRVLLEKELIYCDKEDNAYMVYDRFLGLWLRRNAL